MPHRLEPSFLTTSHKPEPKVGCLKRLEVEKFGPGPALELKAGADEREARAAAAADCRKFPMSARQLAE